jgi:two-component system invasion response regulator UvrY
LAGTGEMIRLLVADDHPIIRQGLKQILEDARDIYVAAEAGNGDEALRKAKIGDIDVAIMDISMPGKNWLDTIRELKITNPHMAVLVLSRFAEVPYVIAALKAGASGYLTKTSVVDELVGAIRRVHSGSQYICPELAEKMAMEMVTGAGKKPHELLSPNETKVMQMLCNGTAIKEIAGGLSLSPSTVSTYKSRILQKMNLKNQAELVRYCVQHGLTD